MDDANGKITCLIGLLEAKGTSFDDSVVRGEWKAVYNKSGTKASKLQKIVGRKEKVVLTSSDFTDVGTFVNVARPTPRGNGVLTATVTYKPLSEGFAVTSDKKIILRRISADITGASFKYKSLPRLPLPLRVKGGYLDFLYLDDDVRITRGNRGGVFVHVRPAVLEKMLAGKK